MTTAASSICGSYISVEQNMILKDSRKSEALCCLLNCQQVKGCIWRSIIKTTCGKFHTWAYNGQKMLKSLGSQRHLAARDSKKKKLRRAQLQRNDSSFSLCINGRVMLRLEG